MPLIDTYRRNVQQKREDIARLTEQKAREQKKVADFSSKIQSANRSLNSTKSASIIQSKMNDIMRYNESIAKVKKTMADIEHKIAQKHKELQNESKRLSDEEIRESKKNAAVQTAMQQKQMQSFDKITRTLKSHAQEIEQLKALPEKINVLFFASNPRDQLQLRLDEEVRSIQEMIRKAKHRDSVKLESCWAVRPMDILQGLNEYQPTIVHFSGHGSDADELVLMDNQQNTKLVSMDAIVQTMCASIDGLRLVFFNTCFSKNQASNVVQYIEAAIGMNKSISDEAARVFSAQFYSSISFGLSVQKSFDQAKAMLMLEGIPEEDTPELFLKNGVDANTMHIVAVSGKED